MSAPRPEQNQLLAALPEAVSERQFAHLEPIEMPLGKVLHEAGGQLRYVYFPTTSIVSLLYVMKDGASADIAVAGKEGLLGIALLMGCETTLNRAIVRSAGHGFRLKAQLLKDELNRGGPVVHLLLRYTQALVTDYTSIE